MKENSGKAVLFLLIAVFVSVSVVSATSLGSGSTPHVEMIYGKSLEGVSNNLVDDNFETFVGASSKGSNEPTIKIEGSLVLEDPVNFKEISYRRYLKNEGSSLERYCYEKVFVEYSNGTLEEIYYKSWDGKSFIDVDNVDIEGSWEDVTEIRVELFASTKGVSSENELRIYEIWTEEDLLADDDDDGYTEDVDCDDSDENVWQIIEGYFDEDLDGDGAGDLLDVCSGDFLVGGYSLNNYDCDDLDASRNTQVDEDCSTDYDDNCDGQINEGCEITCSQDSDCGLPICAGGPNYCDGGDVWQVSNIPICVNPGEYNSTCSSYQAPWLIQSCTWGCFFGSCLGEPGVDEDNDGYNVTVDCDDNDPMVNPGMEEVCTTDHDDDCNGEINEGCEEVCTIDLDCGNPFNFGDAYCFDGNVQMERLVPFCESASCSALFTVQTIQICSNGCLAGACIGELDIDEDDDGYNSSVDCDDNNPLVNPGAIEACNGIDDNCDGEIDEDCSQNDIEAPGNVLGLKAIDRGKDWILWSWENPLDSDFYKAIIYINGENVANTSNNYYKATDLGSGEVYTITIHTMDTSLNVNDTNITYNMWTKGDDKDYGRDDDEKEYLKPVIQFKEMRINESEVNPVVLSPVSSKIVGENSDDSDSGLIIQIILIMGILILIILIFGLV